MPATPIAIAIGQAIRARRLARAPKLTLTDFARTVGVSVPTACCWESGRYKPSLRHLVRISEVLGCSPNDLLVSSAEDGDPDAHEAA